MSRRLTVDLRMVHERDIDPETLRVIRRAAKLRGCELTVRRPSSRLSKVEVQGLARDVCRPFGARKRGPE